MEITNDTQPVLGKAAACICCLAPILKTACRQPLCGACIAPGEARSYCAKCGHRGNYPYEDFRRVMAEHYPHINFGTDIVVRLPACERCKDDGRPPIDDGLARFYGISFE